MTKAQEKRAEEESALEQLRAILHPGDTVWTILHHVSRSGMARSIAPVVCSEDGPQDLTWLAVRAGLGAFDRNHGGVKMGGAGMDMGFALVYNLSRALFPEGFECIGESNVRNRDCPANDHSNPPHPPYVAGSMWHEDGGYALRHRWL